MHHHPEARLVHPLDRHGHQGDAEAQGEARGPGGGVAVDAEQGRQDAAVELLVVHQGHALAPPEGADEFPGAIPALGREEAHAIAEPAPSDPGVDMRIVRGAIGDLAGDARVDDHGGHDFHRRKVSRNEHDALVVPGDGLQPGAVHDLHTGRIGDDLVEDREFRRPPPQGLPLGLEQPVRLLPGKVGEGDPHIGRRDPVGGGQGAQDANDGGPEVGHRVDREETRQEGHHVEGEGLEAPGQVLEKGGSG